MAVTSGDKYKLIELRKRLIGAGTSGSNLFLPSPAEFRRDGVFFKEPLRLLSHSNIISIMHNVCIVILCKQPAILVVITNDESNNQQCI